MARDFNRDVRIAKGCSLYVADVEIVNGSGAVIAATVPVTTTDLTATGNTILGNNKAVDTVTVNSATSLAGTTTVATNEKIQFRDTAIYINSANDGYMDIAADTAVRIASPLVNVASGATVAGLGTGSNGVILKNLKNAAASSLSGTQKDIEIDIGGVPYYFTVYPTKA